LGQGEGYSKAWQEPEMNMFSSPGVDPEKVLLFQLIAQPAAPLPKGKGKVPEGKADLK
jgi:hypothetical protein